MSLKIADLIQSMPDTLSEQFAAMWAKSEKVLQVPAANKLTGENARGRDIVDEYALTAFKRFRFYSWEEFETAWNKTLLNLQRDQAEGDFPSWHYGVLEKGLLKNLKSEEAPALPEPEMSEEERRVNELFENPSHEFIEKVAGQLLSHAEAGLDFMLFGPHLAAIYAAIEEEIGRAAIYEAKRDSKTEAEYRRAILQFWNTKKQEQ